MQTQLRPCISQLTRQSHSLEIFTRVLEFLGYNLTRHSKLADLSFYAIIPSRTVLRLLQDDAISLNPSPSGSLTTSLGVSSTWLPAAPRYIWAIAASHCD